MGSSSATLETLPHDVQHHILSFTNEKTVWRILAVSHTLREVGLVALQPYLSTKVVTNKTPLVVNVFKETDESLAEDSMARRKSLRTISRLSLSHFDAFPTSAASLQRLVLELRDDEDNAGWEVLTRFASSIKHVDLFYEDRLWKMALTEGQDDFLLPEQEVLRQSANTFDVFRRVLDFGAVKFPELKVLSIAATSRVIECLAGLALSTPNLTDLVLSSHWDKAEEDYEYKPAFLWDGSSYGSFSSLERVTLSGTVTLCYAAEELVRSTHKLSHLTLHFTDFPHLELDLFTSFLEALCETNNCIEVFSLYGTRTGDLMRSINDYSRSTAKWDIDPPFKEVKELYLQFEDLDGEGEELGNDSPYTLLSGSWPVRPEFPNLHTLTWIVLADVKHTPPPADEPSLKELFDYYPTLQQVRWMDDFPANPSLPDPTMYPCNGKVTHGVDRLV